MPKPPRPDPSPEDIRRCLADDALTRDEKALALHEAGLTQARVGEVMQYPSGQRGVAQAIKRARDKKKRNGLHLVPGPSSFIQTTPEDPTTIPETPWTKASQAHDIAEPDIVGLSPNAAKKALREHKRAVKAQEDERIIELFGQGYQYEVIARRLGMKPDTVRKRYLAAMQASPIQSGEEARWTMVRQYDDLILTTRRIAEDREFGPTLDDINQIATLLQRKADILGANASKKVDITQETTVKHETLTAGPGLFEALKAQMDRKPGGYIAPRDGDNAKALEAPQDIVDADVVEDDEQDPLQETE